MPIYEYVCQKCGHHLEVMQKMSDKPLSRCPVCRGKLEKVFSQTNFQLKGSGWYVSDYGGRGKADAEKAEKSEKPEKAEKSEKSDKADKTEKTEKSEKTEKPGKADKTQKADSREPVASPGKPVKPKE